MKKNGAVSAMLTPAAGDGWLKPDTSGKPQAFAALSDVATAIPPGAAVHLALPCHSLIIEGLRLPTTERAELAGMVRIQMEKSLPYPLDEVSSDFIVVETTGTDSAVVSLAASHASLDALCRPLREHRLLPQRITPYVLHVAAACPQHETVLAIYPEHGHIVMIIASGGHLCWAHVVVENDAATFATELPQALLAATMEGAPSEFARVLLAAEAAHLSPALRSILAVPIDPLPPVSASLEGEVNLVPKSWRSAAQAQVRARQWRRRLMIVAALYLVAFVSGAVYWFTLQRESQRLAAQLSSVQPALAAIQARQARSDVLAPAFDSHRTAVEVLFLLQRALPDQSTKITELDLQPSQWRVVGEAINAGHAIDYISRLKADPDLKDYEITAGPPTLLPNEHAQFNIFGKR
jgi:type II secretory pathway component PulL